MHPKVIQANIALFTGDRAEAARLLSEYRQTNPEAQGDPQILWLSAHSQINQEACLRQLQELVALAGQDNPYAQMAQEYLDIEAHYQDKLAASALPRIKPVYVWRASLIILLSAILVVLLMNSPRPAVQIPTTPTVVAAQITPTIPVDQSEALVAEGFTTRYDAGILQVAAFEDRSERVANRDGTPVSPVLGGRFYALRLVFECRAGICENPPEAELALKMDNGNVIPMRQDLMILSEEQLQPIALGRVTRGWVVFEIPSISGIQSLLITPESDSNATPVVLTITLPTP